MGLQLLGDWTAVGKSKRCFELDTSMSQEGVNARFFFFFFCEGLQDAAFLSFFLVAHLDFVLQRRNLIPKAGKPVTFELLPLY